MSIVNLNTNPLISIIVITYNSSYYVLETLESVKAQSYQNIELIISDDGSADNSVAVCKVWLQENEKRFSRTELITTSKNTGIPANCNRGLKAAKGTWIKFIAADDTLKANCITDNINYVLTHEKVLFLQTAMHEFQDIINTTNFIAINPPEKDLFKFKLTHQQQFIALIKENFVNAPALFMHKQTLLNINGFDETIKTIEDYPLWLKITKLGHKIYYTPLVTVNYRKHKNSVSKQGKPYINAKSAKDRLLLYNAYRKEYLKPIARFKTVLNFKSLMLLDTLGFNKNTYFSKVLYSLVEKI